MDIDWNAPWVKHAIIACSGIIGYIIVSKIVDSFKQGKDIRPTDHEDGPIDPEWLDAPKPPQDSDDRRG